MKPYDNNITKFQNMRILCTCIAVDENAVSIMSEISISEHLTCNVKLYNIPIENRGLFIGKNELTLNFYENGRHHVIITQFQTSSESQIIDCTESNTTKSSYSVTYYSSVLLYGFNDKKHDIVFNGFSMEITEGEELIGVYPYDTNIDEYDPSHPKISSVGSIVSSPGELFFYFVAPKIIREKEGLQLCSSYTIKYAPSTQINLSDIKAIIQDILLFFEVLSGEMISANSVHLCAEDQIVEYIGVQNFFHMELSCLKSNLGTRSHLRHALFKVSDFNDCFDIAIKNFLKLYKEKILTFKAYQQLLLDDAQGVFTPNYFLKVAQIIEGYQRNEVSETEQEKFDTKKNHIIESLSDPDDKEFITTYTTYNGVNFRKCMKGFTQEALILITKQSKSQILNKTNLLISKIVNDRDLYTHASTKGVLTLSEDDLFELSYCYKVFFRMLILYRLGIPETLIRKRLSYNRRFTFNLEKLFGFSIFSDMSSDTGKFDADMYGYD